VDALIRLVGLVVLAFGLVLMYYTYQNTPGVASGAGLAPSLVPVYYFLGLLLSTAGFVGAFAKFK